MKLSELIEELKAIEKYKGDCDVVIACPEYCDAERVEYHKRDEYHEDDDYIVIGMER